MKNDGFAIGSIVLGVLSLFAWYLSPWKSVGIVLSVMGLGYGIVARHTRLHRLAIAGALVSGIGLLANFEFRPTIVSLASDTAVSLERPGVAEAESFDYA